MSQHPSPIRYPDGAYEWQMLRHQEGKASAPLSLSLSLFGLFLLQCMAVVNILDVIVQDDCGHFL